MIVRRSLEVGISGVGPHCQATELVSVTGLYSHYGYLGLQHLLASYPHIQRRKWKGQEGGLKGENLPRAPADSPYIT